MKRLYVDTIIKYSTHIKYYRMYLCLDIIKRLFFKIREIRLCNLKLYKIVKNICYK